MAYQAVDSGYGAAQGQGQSPPMGWGDGLFGCFSDCEVCWMGMFPLGCMQYLFAANAASAGTEEFQPAMLKMLGLTLLVPNVLAAAAASAPAAAAAIGPLNTLNQLALSWYGMTHRQAMRRKFNIVGGTELSCFSCFSFLCDGDREKLDDFCVYLCCFPCAVCQETRHLRRYNLGTIAQRFRPYNPAPVYVVYAPGGMTPPQPPAMGIPVAAVAVAPPAYVAPPPVAPSAPPVEEQAPAEKTVEETKEE